MEIVSNVALISINETLIVQLLSFLVFLFLLNRVMIRPLRASITRRSAYVDDLEKGIAEAKLEMATISSRIAEAETAAVRKANRQREDLETAGRAEAVLIIQSAREEIEQLKQQTDEEVAELIRQARKHVQGESERISVHIMEKVLCRKLMA